MTWTLRANGRTVTLDEGEERRTSVLRVDGETVAEETCDYWGKHVLEHDDLRVQVQWGPTNHVTAVRRLEDGPDGGLDFEPPAGSRAARREALRRDHPVRFTLLSVAIAAGQVAAGVLGFGALITAFVQGLLPRLDLSWDWLPTLPSIDWPDWLQYLSPGYWLAKVPWPDLPDLPQLLPEWLTGSARYWVPLLVAAVVAQHEIARRRAQDRAREGDEGPPETPDP